MILTIEDTRNIQLDPRAVDWDGKKLKVDGDYGPRTRWWHGISALPSKRIEIVCTFLKYNGRKEDQGRPNRSKWIDEIQEPGGLGVGNPWCIAFVMHVLRECGFHDWPYFMSAYELLDWAESEGLVTSDPLPGDIYAFLYNPKAKGFSPGHGGGLTSVDPNWAAVCDGNSGNAVKTGRRARQGLTFIRTVKSTDPPLIMPPLNQLSNLDGSLAGTR